MQKNTLSLISKYRTPLMGFAALWILFFHEWRSLFGDTILGKAERFMTGMGYFGVDIFFFLSGMGLVYAISKYSVPVFYKRRFTRILIPGVLALTLRALFKGWDLGFYFATLVGYHFWTLNIYTSMWFYFAIMTLYLLFPLYYRFFSKAKNKYLFTAAVLVVWYFLSNALYGIQRFDLYGFTNRIPIFLTGVLAGSMKQEKKEISFTWVHMILCFVLFAVGFYVNYLANYLKQFVLVPSSECFLPAFLITIACVGLLPQLFFLLEKSFIGNRIVKMFTFLGTMSLELYCIQEIFMRYIQELLYPHFHDAIINVLNFAITITCAWLFRKTCNFLYKVLKLS